MASVRVQLLETFGVTDSNTKVRLPGRAQRLIALLALRGPTHRSVVAGTLWPDVPEQQAMGSLRTSAWRLNHLVPGLIHADGVHLALSGDVAIDSREQESFAVQLLREHREDTSWLLAGLDHLWHRELLPGWYDDWVTVERERLSHLRLCAMEHAAGLLTRQGMLAPALQLALEAVRSEPLREAANAALVSVYVAEGNAYDAIHHYNFYRECLDRELGLQPSPAMKNLVPRQRHRP